ncbi:hypothetical protein ACFX2B_027574 [Malus domestica]
MSLPKCIYTLRLSHHFSTATKTASAVRLPKLSNVPTRYKSETIKQAQQALTDYLHATRSLSFPSAEHISKNCLFSLTNLIKKIEFSVPKFSNRFKRLLRYHPINEFEFFFESIGIDYNQVCDFLPPNKYFFSEDGTLLNVATELSRFGFPWNMLGKLYEEEISIFSESSEVLKARLSRLKECGFSNHSVVGMCLAFPYLLAVEGEPGGDAALFDDFKRVLVEFDMEYCVEGNVDAWYDVCKKVRVFCDLGCGKGKIGELMGRKKDVFLTCPAEVLCQKSRYFCRFGVRKEDVGLFLLQSPEVLNFDLETPNISALGLLEIFGLNVKEIEAVIEKYPHVMGKNKMANLPHVIRALDLHEWFFTKIKNEPQLLENNVISDFDEDIAKEFGEGLERIQSTTTPIHTMRKLDFMHSIGFGENTLTLKALSDDKHDTKDPESESRIFGSQATVLVVERSDTDLIIEMQFPLTEARNWSAFLIKRGSKQLFNSISSLKLTRSWKVSEEAARKVLTYEHKPAYWTMILEAFTLNLILFIYK